MLDDPMPSATGSWYFAEIDRSGTISLSKGVGGQVTDLMEDTVANPDTGRRVGSITDNTFSQGTIGMFTDVGVAPDGVDPNGETIFRRVRVWEP